jgi:hypothetical protein
MQKDRSDILAKETNLIRAHRIYLTQPHPVGTLSCNQPQPGGLDKLLDLGVEGDYRDFVRLREVTVEVFGELEILYEQPGLPLVDVDLDPDSNSNAGTTLIRHRYDFSFGPPNSNH